MRKYFALTFVVLMIAGFLGLIPITLAEEGK